MQYILKLWQWVRTHKKTTAALVLALVVAVLVTRCISSRGKPEYVTAVVERSDVRQTVEAVGTVVSERELELRFAATGIVSSVYVKEGDRVKAGQRLAQLRAGSLGASVAAQRASLDQALADLRALQEGSRPEDIAIAEADLQSKQASLDVATESLTSSQRNLGEAQMQLDAVQREANVNLSGQISTALSGLTQYLGSVESGLATVDEVLSRTDVNDAIAKGSPSAGFDIQQRKRDALNAIAVVRSAALQGGEYDDVIATLSRGTGVAQQSVAVMDSLYSLISSLGETSYFTASARDTVRSIITTDRATILSASQSIASLLSTFQNAAAAYDTKIAASKASMVSFEGTRDKAKRDILTYQSAVQAARAQLDLKKAGARQTDIQAAEARVRQQQAMLARYGADYADTVLTAPIDGTVTHVNIRIGESLPVGAAVTLLGDSPYRIEMFVSEIDIPKVLRTQSGSIELDAFRNAPFTLRVGDVDTAATDKDGVPKYRVRLDFVQRPSDVKVGMTGDAEITTDHRASALHVPARSVLSRADGTSYVRVLPSAGADIVETDITTGIEGSAGEVEVLSGLMEGQTVVVLEKK